MVQIKEEDFIPLEKLIQRTQSEKVEISTISKNHISFEITGSKFIEGATPKDHIQNKVTFRISDDCIVVSSLYFINKRQGTGTETIKWLENFAISKNIFKISIYGVNIDNGPMIRFCNRLKYEEKLINGREIYYNYEKELT